MNDANYDLFRARLVSDRLIFDNEEASETAQTFNTWRFQHLLGMALVAADATEEVTIDGDFDVNRMLVELDEKMKLSEAGIYSIEDLLASLATIDADHARAPDAGEEAFDLTNYAGTLEGIIARSKEKRPWRVGEPPHAITKTAFPGEAPEIPLPPALRDDT